MSWLVDHKSQLSTENKILLYTCIQPMWTYEVILWGCVRNHSTQKLYKDSNLKFFQWFFMLGDTLVTKPCTKTLIYYYSL